MKRFEEFKENKFEKLIEINPTTLYSSQNTRDLSEKVLDEYIEKGKVTDIENVAITGKYDSLFIIDGHHRVLAAARNEKDWITAYTSECIPGMLDKSAYYDFEDIGNFRYEKYPDFFMSSKDDIFTDFIKENAELEKDFERIA